MATYRGSNHQIGASSVWANGDLANIIENLYRQSIRTGARGEYERGLRDMAQSIADATNSEIDLYPDGRYDLQNVNVHAERITEHYERIEERHERTVERYAPPPPMPSHFSHFAIVGQCEEWPAPQPDPTAPQLAQTDVGITDFVPGTGDLRRMEAGWMWIGNNGEKTFFPVQQWAELSAADARALGFLLAENRRVALVLRTIVEQRRPQLDSPRAPRITQQDRRQLR